MKFRKNQFINLVSLSGIHYLNYIIPVFTYPFLLSKLGSFGFGEYILQQSIISYWIVLINFSFDLTGPILVANSKSKRQLNYTLSKIFATKFSLLLIGYLGLEIFLYLYQSNSLLNSIYRIGYITVIGNSFYSAWVFRGINQNKELLLLVTIVRVVYCLTLFFLVRSPSDIKLAVLLNSASVFIYGFLSFVMMRCFVGFKPIFIPIRHLLKILNNEWHILVSNIFVTIYLTCNIFFLKFFSFTHSIGPFAFAQKVFEFTANSATPVNQSFVKSLADSYNSDKSKFVVSARRKERMIFIFYSILSVIFFLGIYFYLIFVDHSENIKLILVSFLYMNIFTPFVAFGQFYTNIFSILGHNSIILKISSLIFGVTIISSFLLTKYLGITGASISLGFTVFTVFLINHFFYLKLRPAT